MAFLGDPLNPVFGVTSGSAVAVPLSSTVGPLVAVTIAPTNTARQICYIWNETGTLYVQAGPSASDTNYCIRLIANQGSQITGYTGAITAIKASGTTAVRVTDIG